KGLALDSAMKWVYAENNVGTGGSLTISEASAVVDTINFAGNYTTANFNVQSDGNGGTLVLSTVAPTAGGCGATTTLNGAQTDLISEAVNGFDLADLSVGGGTLGALTESDATHYTATFTPTVGATAGAIQVLASGTGTSSWTDAVSNAGTASNIFAISESTV